MVDEVIEEPIKPAGLEIRDLSKNFGGIHAVSNVSFSIAPDELVGIIGPNGAGKTTCLSLISGFLQPSNGQVRFAGKDLAGMSASDAARLGLVRTFQHTTLTNSATAFENVFAATYLHGNRSDDHTFAHPGNQFRRCEIGTLNPWQKENANEVDLPGDALNVALDVSPFWPAWCLGL